VQRESICFSAALFKLRAYRLQILFLRIVRAAACLWLSSDHHKFFIRNDLISPRGSGGGGLWQPPTATHSWQPPTATHCTGIALSRNVKTAVAGRAVSGSTGSSKLQGASECRSRPLFGHMTSISSFRPASYPPRTLASSPVRPPSPWPIAMVPSPWPSPLGSRVSCRPQLRRR
jgi:hypothetical protein